MGRPVVANLLRDTWGWAAPRWIETVLHCPIASGASEDPARGQFKGTWFVRFRGRWVIGAVVVAVAASSSIVAFSASDGLGAKSTVTTGRAPLLTGPGWRVTENVAGKVGPVADRRWLAGGTVPGAGSTWAEMVRYALVDLRQLTGPNGSVAAGAGENWGYAWPRDNAFVAAALAKTGHHQEADLILQFLQAAQENDGGFEARYLLSADRSPDSRTRQSDGAGWVLWALDEVASSSSDRHATATRFRAMLDSATAFSLSLVGDGTRLPAPSPDYWERRESQLTLGTAAPLLTGLWASARLYQDLGERTAATRSRSAADGLEHLITRSFEPGGYQRYELTGGADAAICFLMPPFNDRPSASVVAAWERYQVDAARPAGGLAPGVSWKQDGISWTPETALVAYTAAASGRPQNATRWLNWLDAHRTDWDSLPEKVLADGAPAGPAPLAWTAASVVLAAAALQEQPTRQQNP